MTTQTACVRVIDDDVDLLEAMQYMLASEGWGVRTYVSAEEFLKNDDVETPGCVLLDYCMPGTDGLKLQQQLRARGYPHPILFLTAHADVDMAIAAFRRGADDVLRKPVPPSQLFEAVSKAVQRDMSAREDRALYSEAVRAFASLTERERQVIELVHRGLMNWQVAERLSVSERTVEVHRANGYRKLGVRTLAGLGVVMQRVREYQVG